MKKIINGLLYAAAIICTIFLVIVLKSLIVEGWQMNFAMFHVLPAVLNTICFWKMAISKNPKKIHLWLLILIPTLLDILFIITLAIA